MPLSEKHKQAVRRVTKGIMKFHSNKRKGIIGPINYRKLNVVKNTYPANQHQPFPRKMKTKMTISATGYIPSGNNSAVYLLSAWGNAIYTPLTGANSTVPNSGISAGYVLALTGATTMATANPVGYTQYSQIYQEYKVTSSSIRVTILPEALIDSLNLTVFPCTNQSAVADSFVGTIGSVIPKSTQASQLPFSKSRLCSSNNFIANNTIKHYMSTAKVNGLTPKQVTDSTTSYIKSASQPDTTAGNQDNELPWYWFISAQQTTNTNFANPIPITVEIVYYVELSEPVMPLV